MGSYTNVLYTCAHMHTYTDIEREQDRQKKLAFFSLYKVLYFPTIQRSPDNARGQRGINASYDLRWSYIL